MKINKKLIVAVSCVLLGLALIVAVFLYHFSLGDRCSQYDRTHHNCVPAGRCTPLGDPREATIDCQLKNYDHKFSL